MTSSPDDSALPRPGLRSADHVPPADLPARASAAGDSRATASSDDETAPPDGGAPCAEKDGSPSVTDRGRSDDGLPREIGGQAGPEPTRYGDWEKKGRCTDF